MQCVGLQCRPAAVSREANCSSWCPLSFPPLFLHSFLFFVRKEIQDKLPFDFISFPSDILDFPSIFFTSFSKIKRGAGDNPRLENHSRVRPSLLPKSRFLSPSLDMFPALVLKLCVLGRWLILEFRRAFKDPKKVKLQILIGLPRIDYNSCINMSRIKNLEWKSGNCYLTLQ